MKTRSYKQKIKIMGTIDNNTLIVNETHLFYFFLNSGLSNWFYKTTNLSINFNYIVKILGTYA